MAEDTGTRTPPSEARCKCESCRIARDAALMTATAAEVAFTVYWSLTCSRCGCRIPYVGLQEMATCQDCDAEMKAEIAADRAQRRDVDLLDWMQRARDLPWWKRRERTLLLDDAIDRLIRPREVS